MINAALPQSSNSGIQFELGSGSEMDRLTQLPANKLIRTLHLINGQHYSGAERVQDLLAMRLPEEGFEVAFACLKPDRFPTLRQSSGLLYEVPMRSKTDFSVVRKLIELVRQEGFAVLHAHSPRTALIGRFVSARTGCPLVYHVHSPTSRDSTRAFRNILNQLVERACVGGAKRVITVSRSLAEHMQRQGVQTSRLAVVANGVPAAQQRRPKVRPAGVWTLGTVALHRPRKGIEVLLDAMAELRSVGLQVRLRAVGPFETTEYEQTIKARVDVLQLRDAVDWIGFTQDVEFELRNMDLFVLPSLFGEGLPMVVLEAMAVGLPIVSTRVEGIPEAVRDGMDGLLAEPNDAHALARCLERVIRGDLPWLELSDNAFGQHAARFSDKAMAAGVADVYRDILVKPFLPN